MKKTLFLFSCIMLVLSAPMFAAIRVSQHSPDVTASNPKSPFAGKIRYVSYFYFNGTQPTIQVDLMNEENQFLDLTLSEAELPLGFSLFNAVGKPLVVEFTDTQFTVGGVFTYPNHLNDPNLVKKYIAQRKH